MFIKAYARPSELDYFVDFETYYDEDIGLSVNIQGNLGYVTDPRFYAYMVSIYRIDEEIELVYVGPCEDAPWEEIADGNWWAWNAGFDKAVYDHGLKFARPKGPNRWDDAAALAAYLGYSREFAHCMKEFDGTYADKGIRARAEKKRDRSNFTDAEWAEMLQYCADDSKGGAKFVYEKACEWPEEERDIAMHTVNVAHNGFEVDWPLVEWGRETLQRVLIECESNMPWVTEMDMTPLSKKGLGIVCRENGIPAPASLAQDSEELEKWLAEYAGEFDFVKNMQRWRAANTLLKKLDVFAIRRRQGTNRLDYGFKYYAAHTGRWGGDSKTNVQALHKDEVEGLHLRSCIIAPPGKKLLIFDFSQIEPRVLGKMSGDTRFLQLMMDGYNPYEAHAAATMDWVREEGKKMKNTHPELYALAKARVLGLGYGCGWEKFIVVAWIMAGLRIDEATSKKTVNNYRATNKIITGYWERLETLLARASIRPKGQRNQDIILPSGRPQTYTDIERRGGKIFAKTERGRPHKALYGGKLCENVVQAAARDVLRDCLIRLENYIFDNSLPWFILFHVHDEVIMEVDEELEGDAARVKELYDVICETPAWLAGCRLDTEMIFSDHYLK